MRLHLLFPLSVMSALHRVDDASSGGAVIALNSTADDRPLWADGRLAIAVAAAEGSLIELAQPPQTTTLALTTACDGQEFVDVAVVASKTTHDACDARQTSRAQRKSGGRHVSSSGAAASIPPSTCERNERKHRD